MTIEEDLQKEILKIHLDLTEMSSNLARIRGILEEIIEVKNTSERKSFNASLQTFRTELKKNHGQINTNQIELLSLMRNIPAGDLKETISNLINQLNSIVNEISTILSPLLTIIKDKSAPISPNILTVIYTCINLLENINRAEINSNIQFNQILNILKTFKFKGSLIEDPIDYYCFCVALAVLGYKFIMQNDIKVAAIILTADGKEMAGSGNNETAAERNHAEIELLIKVIQRQRNINQKYINLKDSSLFVSNQPCYRKMEATITETRENKLFSVSNSTDKRYKGTKFSWTKSGENEYDCVETKPSSIPESPYKVKEIFDDPPINRESKVYYFLSGIWILSEKRKYNLTKTEVDIEAGCAITLTDYPEIKKIYYTSKTKIYGEGNIFGTHVILGNKVEFREPHPLLHDLTIKCKDILIEENPDIIKQIVKLAAEIVTFTGITPMTTLNRLLTGDSPFYRLEYKFQKQKISEFSIKQIEEAMGKKFKIKN